MARADSTVAVAVENTSTTVAAETIASPEASAGAQEKFAASPAGAVYAVTPTHEKLAALPAGGVYGTFR